LRYNISYAMTNLFFDSLQAFKLFLDKNFAYMTFVDVLDVALITLFFSFSFVILQRRTSRAFLFALLSLVFTFVAAQSLNMYLTLKMLQVCFLAFSVGLVIVFQEDFRRALESLSSWRLWERGDSGLSTKLTDTLVECLFNFAKTKTGALIVLGGRQPLDGHLRLGIPLQGQISGPLLESIFDPHSAGHDGAVIIMNGMLDRFGTHLPLSRHAGATGRLGTRHAAALGLVEKCDALVLVVSEETGTVSIAKKGEMKAAESVAEVRDAIRVQAKRLKPRPHRSLLEIPWGRLSISLVIAFALWASFVLPQREKAAAVKPAASEPGVSLVPAP